MEIDITKTIEEEIDALPSKLALLKRQGYTVILTQCDILPYEVLASFGLVALKLPRWVLYAFIMKNEKYTQALDFCRLADVVVTTKHCNCLPQEIQNFSYIFQYKGGFAEDAVIDLHISLQTLLGSLGINKEYPDIGVLHNVVLQYENIRKMMRTMIFHGSKLSQSQIQLVCDAAFSLLPQDVVRLLQQLQDTLEINRASFADEAKPKTLAYIDCLDWSVLDTLSEYCTIVEDDGCNGRRQFDISCNPHSQNLYYELLYSFSFKAWCPGMRKSHERYELIYKPLANYDIKLVLLLTSVLESRNAHINYLWENCLLQGTDAYIASPHNVQQKMREYREAMKLRPHYKISVDI